jgi:plasmid maintenance system antidote protein VapI
VVEIRESIVAGETTQTELARRFGVHPCTVNAVVKGRTWRSDV